MVLGVIDAGVYGVGKDLQHGGWLLVESTIFALLTFFTVISLYAAADLHRVLRQRR